MYRVKGIGFLWGMLSPARLLMRGSGIFVQKTSSLQDSWRRVQHFPGGQLANFYGKLTCDFQDDGGPNPLPLF